MRGSVLRTPATAQKRASARNPSSPQGGEPDPRAFRAALHRPSPAAAAPSMRLNPEAAPSFLLNECYEYYECTRGALSAALYDSYPGPYIKVEGPGLGCKLLICLRLRTDATPKRSPSHFSDSVMLYAVVAALAASSAFTGAGVPSSAVVMAPRVSYAPEMMAGGGKAAELRKGAKYVAKKGTGPKNKDFAKDASKTAKNVASASLFGLFGGAFAPRGRELEVLAPC